MNRILLFLDDYSELMFVQIILKKLGFDVDTLQNAHTLVDRLISFRPDILILNEESRRVSSEFLVNQARTQISGLCCIYVKPNISKIEKIDSNTLRINSPIHPIELIQATSECCGVKADVMIEKFKKFKGQLAQFKDQPGLKEFKEQTDETIEIKKDSFTGERSESYSRFLKENNVKASSTFSPTDVNKNLKVERAQSERADEIDKDRKTFVSELFKKAKD